MPERDQLSDRDEPQQVKDARAAIDEELARLDELDRRHRRAESQDPSADLENVNAAYVIERDDNAELRAGISWARGMCSDGRPVEEIDHFLGCVLAGEAQLPPASDEIQDGETT